MPYSDPKFPVVNPNPSVDDCLSALRFRDWAVLGGISAGAWSYGYIMGRPARMATASTAFAIGITFAGFVVLQDTRARLLGYKENAKEVTSIGMHAIQPNLRLKASQQDPRFPTATGMASESTKPKLDW
eukprot:CAMPEP_0197829214 /NCGR_PEP_ID=MMETSP1437-20131217/5653_1 /TAXON_ID=49252 ORGANISM="Eucampia antarctica, Strain CCMP1452" /NCGR_SAMPLE_ID=MMETSP1437 /ASSEMBLY_ACC=CAM_ASM_001096 /LENGTH=128 /DNA_ID=CAMNT_0043430751 /DNA_START=258 /DNA_END=641 /DNA_ORIENTATION=+